MERKGDKSENRWKRVVPRAVVDGALTGGSIFLITTEINMLLLSPIIYGTGYLIGKNIARIQSETNTGKN